MIEKFAEKMRRLFGPLHKRPGNRKTRRGRVVRGPKEHSSPGRKRYGRRRSYLPGSR